MYPNNYFIPNQTLRMIPNGLSINPIKNGGIFSSLKSINWGGLLNNANKTLNVVNQTIPLVRQAGPMINNMKSMIKLASAFKDETEQKEKNIRNSKEETINSSQNYSNDININHPSFFV